MIRYENFNLNQCLFGEHLINKYPNYVVGVVESEKTALIASMFFDDLLWLATGGKSNMKLDKFRVLRNRKVCLFPDLNSYDDWSNKADELSKVIRNITISDKLEKDASQKDRLEGFDLADYILESYS